MRLTHVRLLVSDMSAAVRFYKDALELETEWEENPGYAEFRIGPETQLAIFPRDEMAQVVDVGSPAGDRAAMTLKVESVDQAIAGLRERGVEPATEPTDRSDWGLRFAHVRDPDGNLIELYQDIEWVRE